MRLQHYVDDYKFQAYMQERLTNSTHPWQTCLLNSLPYSGK